MYNPVNAFPTAKPLFLEDRSALSRTIQLFLLSSAVLLPIFCHWLELPVRMILPMHWPVLMAGMLYGWRTGAVTGALAPLLSFLISGYPMPNILPSMTFELFVYGGLAGLLRTRWNSFAAITAAIVAGRLVFIAAVLLTGRATFGDTEYFSRALLPGIIPALVQIILLPFVVQWILEMQKER